MREELEAQKVILEEMKQYQKEELWRIYNSEEQRFEVAIFTSSKTRDDGTSVTIWHNIKGKQIKRASKKKGKVKFMTPNYYSSAGIAPIADNFLNVKDNYMKSELPELEEKINRIAKAQRIERKILSKDAQQPGTSIKIRKKSFRKHTP